MKDARQVAAEALYKVERESAWSNLVLDNMLQENMLTRRDSAFASALFYGVLERAYTLDQCVAAHCSVKLRRLSPAVLTVLRCGLYQLLYMDGVPDSAAVNESVELAKKLRQHKSAGLVNAVLHAFLRAGKRIPLPHTDKPEDLLAVEFSCPPELVRLWIRSYGEDTARHILSRSLGRPPLGIRANTRKTTPAALAVLLEAQGVSVREDPALPGCLALEGTGSIRSLPQFREGLFHVQDKSSQLCALAVDAAPGMQVLDACAAPGGKSFTIAQHMQNTGRLLAVDLHPQRVGLIARRGAELGLSIIEARAADMTKPQPGLGQFDRVLCDVPCSGLGVIRRKPEIKYKPLAELEKYPDIQYKILENSAQYCRRDGLLFYSTCTLNPAENTGVAERFLAHHPEFLPHPLTRLGEDGWSRTILEEEDADGFFLACFRRA